MEIEEAIGRCTPSGLAILLVEQYLELALRLADRFVILDAGEVVRAGVAAESAGRVGARAARRLSDRFSAR